MAKIVLIADDNPMIRKMLCRMFEGELDYDICAEATNGQEAIDLALKHRPDLVILDLSMPVLNGSDAAREFKKANASRSDNSLYAILELWQQRVRYQTAL